MKLRRTYSIATLVAVLLGAAATTARAGISESEQSAIRAKYAEKVLVFRNCYRLVKRVEVLEDGTVKGKAKPGYWSMDGAFQVKALLFEKDRVTLKGRKLWADIRQDGRLHYIPAALVLKGRGEYPEGLEVAFRTGSEAETASQFAAQVNKVFFNEQENALASAPAPISRYIRNEAVQVDVDPAAGAGFKGTPPKPLATPQPYLSVEAAIVGVTGVESFVLLVDEQGRATVEGFTTLQQYGLEEATMEAVKKWKFEPGILDGKPVPLRIAMNIDYKAGVR